MLYRRDLNVNSRERLVDFCSFEVYKLTGTPESLVVVTPPNGMLMFLFCIDGKARELFRHFQKKRAGKKRYTAELKKMDFNCIPHPTNFVMSGNAEIFLMIMPDTYVEAYFEYFSKQIGTFGEDSFYLYEECQDFVKPDQAWFEELEKFIVEQSKPRRFSKIWNQIENRAGRVEVANKLLNSARSFNDLERNHALVMKVMGILNWPYFSFVEKYGPIPEGRFALMDGEIIDYQTDVRAYHENLLRSYPFLFEDPMQLMSKRK